MLNEIIILEYKKKLKPHLDIYAQFKSLIQVWYRESKARLCYREPLWRWRELYSVIQGKGKRPLKDNLTDGGTKFIRNWYSQAMQYVIKHNIKDSRERNVYFILFYKNYY